MDIDSQKRTPTSGLDDGPLSLRGHSMIWFLFEVFVMVLLAIEIDLSSSLIFMSRYSVFLGVQA